MRTLVIANRAINDRDRISRERVLRERLASSLAGIEYAAAPGDGTRIALRAAQDKVDTVVALGGDGTVNEVVNGIVGTQTALGLIPAGRANDLASLYRVPEDTAAACGIINDRRLARADVVGVNGKCYVTGGGIGVPAEVARAANAARRGGSCMGRLGAAAGKAVYLLAAARALGGKAPQGPPVTVRWDGESLRTRPLALMVNNQAFVGRRFLLSPGAVNCDGLGDVCLIEEPGSRLQRLALLPRVLTGRHVFLPWVRRWRTRELVIESEIPRAYLGDGELLLTDRIFRVRIHPGALFVVVPGDRNEVCPCRT